MPYDPMQIRGKSARWTSYDLVNGVIVPASGAELREYDPWEDFVSNRGKYRTVDQPYSDLLELSRQLSEAESRKVFPSYTAFDPKHLPEAVRGAQTEADELVLNWCNKHGLLGIVPVLCGSINVGDEVHFRDGGEWVTLLTIRETMGALTVKKTAIESGSKSLQVAASDPPGRICTWYNWLTCEFERKPIEHLMPFFRPEWRDAPLLPPRPNSDQFWTQYGEPLHDFVDWCDHFTFAVSYKSRWRGANATLDEDDAVRTVIQSHRLLRGLAQAVSLASSFDPVRNKVHEERMAPGLLASYALMFLYDQEFGRRALQCERCSRYFVSNESRARYCSPRCRNTAQSSRYRSKKTSRSR